jgi:hypothetical protein
MAVRMSASRAGRPLPPGIILVLISVRGWVDPRAIVRLEGLGQLKNPTPSSGIKPETLRLTNYVDLTLHARRRSPFSVCHKPFSDIARIADASSQIPSGKCPYLYMTQSTLHEVYRQITDIALFVSNRWRRGQRGYQSFSSLTTLTVIKLEKCRMC